MEITLGEGPQPASRGRALPLRSLAVLLGSKQRCVVLQRSARAALLPAPGSEPLPRATKSGRVASGGCGGGNAEKEMPLWFRHWGWIPKF